MSEDSAKTDNDYEGANAPRGVLIRRAADDELSPEQGEALKAKQQGEATDEDARIAFEKALKERVGAVMSKSDAAPEALRDAVKQIFADERTGGATEPLGGERTRSQSFWSSRGVRRFLAAAAVVALAITAVFLGNQIGTGPGAGGNLAGVFGSLSDRTELVSFVAGEHDKCSDFGSYFERKMQPSPAEQARQQIAAYLGRAPVSFELGGVGYAFAGYGACAVPGPGESVHLIYRSLSSDSNASMSLFIQKDTGRLALEEERRYAIREEGRDTPVVLWRSGGLVYYLVSPERPAPSQATESLGAPAEEVVI